MQAKAKSIGDKQLIRSIADVVVSGPVFALNLFSRIDGVVNIFPELAGVIDFIFSLPDNKHYYRRLRVVIDAIDDDDTRAIFLNALKSEE